jgi:hypothetical protein
MNAAGDESGSRGGRFCGLFAIKTPEMRMNIVST